MSNRNSTPASRPYVDRPTLREALDVSDATIQRLIASGVIPKDRRGLYDLVGAASGYIRAVMARRVGRDGLEGSASLASQRAAEELRLTKHRADLAEMEAAERAGELVHTTFLIGKIGNAASTARTAITGVPSKVAPLVIQAKTPAEAQEIIGREIDAAFDDLDAHLADMIRNP